jgi:tRNA G18 (ribose-2'-O)-methylase SpoU
MAAVIPITAADDARISSYRNIRDAALLREHGLFVAEGRLVVERVLTDGRYRVESLLLNPAALDALQPLIAQRAPDAVIFQCPAAAFASITGFDLHRGCVAMVRRPRRLTWAEAVGTSPLIVVLEGVTNADNVGAVFRNAAAFGAGAVLLSPTCCDPLYRKAIRTSMGYALRVPFAHLEPWPDVLAELRTARFTAVALSPRETSVPLDVFAHSRTAAAIALLVGTEAAGLTPGVERNVDVHVRIDMSAGVDSLNLAVASGIALSRLASRN